LLFTARNTASPDWLKFMYKPAVKKESWGDYVFIGTGDRETPDDTHTVNYFYGIKNKWDSTTLLPLMVTSRCYVVYLFPHRACDPGFELEQGVVHQVNQARGKGRFLPYNLSLQQRRAVLGDLHHLHT
jgi:hypothetical protein